ncbi:helix-turn-helix transcriptional regulator [Burkholderia sp. Ac-20353]|uniref:helix-turn-helix domain-containing protein n=1 Tax=Burkholderia sp. Ac-20353 TaxID=2703894 RepID=UPI00197C55BE|nr:helix-turn-helix transcriptional regulator [Burkholderia sp. Ac-20353]MBN3789304.1 helix-turn-helix transcriptional regulator [Burkholderia sp. Ac-20353]
MIIKPTLGTPQSPGPANDDPRVSSILRERLVAARLRHQLEQQDAAKLLGYQNSSALSKIEGGQANMPRGLLVRAAVAYSVSTDFLLGLTDDPERDLHLRMWEMVEGDFRNDVCGFIAWLRRRAELETQSQPLLRLLLFHGSKLIDAHNIAEGRDSRRAARARREVEDELQRIDELLADVRTFLARIDRQMPPITDIEE